MYTGGAGTTPALPARVQVAHPRRRQHRQHQPMSPHTTRNPTIPTAAQIRMFVIAHLVSVLSFGTPWRPGHAAESAFPPDGAHYALFRSSCMLGKQRNRKSEERLEMALVGFFFTSSADTDDLKDGEAAERRRASRSSRASTSSRPSVMKSVKSPAPSRSFRSSRKGAQSRAPPLKGERRSSTRRSAHGRLHSERWVREPPR